jgi:hypothetical protein
MDLGTGIFLSCAMLALVLLYGFTKDRWRWRKLVGRTLLVSVILAAGAAGAIAIAHYWDELFPTRLTRQTQYAGLKLGISPQEVMYIKGYPPVVLGQENADPEWKGFFTIIKTSELEKGKKVTDYKNWSYDHYKHNINVEFNNERTAVIRIQCYSEDKIARCPSIGSVWDGTSEQEALRKLGGPAEQRIDGVSKSVRFPNLGVRLTLTQEQVYILEVYDPQSDR